MTRLAWLGLLVGVALAAHPSIDVAHAQPSPPTGQPPRRLGDLDPTRVTMLRNRYHVRQMESVLARAVEHAADLMTRRLTTVSPDVMALAGAPSAQGFRIDSYGFFFAVEVPRLSDSMNWALQVLSNRHDERALSSLQRLAESQTDPVLRADLDSAIRSLRRQHALRGLPLDDSAAGPNSHPARASSIVSAASASDLGAGTPGPEAAAASTPPSVPPPSQPEAAVARSAAIDMTLLSNPSAAYEDEIKDALTDALLDYALTLPLAPGEWVTVAARDAGYIAFPDALAEMVTVTLSVKVDDLVQLRMQQIDRAEARRRVLLREF